MNKSQRINPNTKQMVGGCCVCLGEQVLADNPLVYCDGQGCTVAVHKACYGIMNSPEGSWLCRKCEFEGDDDTTCKLCPSKDGALKRTEHGGWAHVVCALYIPEIKFENDSTLEPIILKRVPLERYNKICCICESKGHGSKAKFGACMNCNKPGCQNHFHVTCGQSAGGLNCEKKGNCAGFDAYCGYCPHHQSQSKREREAIKPLVAVTISSDLAPEMSALTDSSEQVSGSASSHVTKKKKRKKPGRRSSRRVGICGNWTYSMPTVILDSVELNDREGGASKPLKGEMDPFTNVLTGVGLIPKEAVGESNVGSVNSTEDLIQKEDENSEGLKSSVAPIDDPSEPGATLEECAAIYKEPSRSETPRSLCDYDSESTLSNTSDFGSNMKYNLDYVFSQMGTSNLENELESEPKSSRSKTAKASDAPSSSSDSAHGKQHSSKRKKKKTTSSLLVTPPVILERSHPETSSPEQFHSADSSCSSSATKEPASQQKSLVSEPHLPDSKLNPASGSEQEMSESMSGELDMHNSSAFALPSSAAPDPHPMAEQFERIWEEGNQFLMEEGQHHEVASLLASLHILRQSNTQLEGHVDSLIQRRNDLLDANAILSIPLIAQPRTRARSTTNTGSLIDESMHVFLRELGKICNLLSSSSPEMAVSASTSTKEQQLPQLHRPIIHPTSSVVVPGQLISNDRQN